MGWRKLKQVLKRSSAYWARKRVSKTSVSSFVSSIFRIILRITFVTSSVDASVHLRKRVFSSFACLDVSLICNMQPNTVFYYFPFVFRCQTIKKKQTYIFDNFLRSSLFRVDKIIRTLTLITMHSCFGKSDWALTVGTGSKHPQNGGIFTGAKSLWN